MLNQAKSSEKFLVQSHLRSQEAQGWYNQEARKLVYLDYHTYQSLENYVLLSGVHRHEEWVLSLGNRSLTEMLVLAKGHEMSDRATVHEMQIKANMCAILTMTSLPLLNP